MAPKQLLMQSLIACVDILWNTHTHNPSCFSTLLRSMAETESSEGPPHCHYKDIMFSVQDDTTFGLRFCNITMLHGGHQQNHSCLAAVVRLQRPEKATALLDVVFGLSPLGFQHEDVGLHDDIGLQSKLVSRPLFGLQVVAKANQTGYSVVPPPAQAKADHGVLGIMSSSCSKECELN